MINTLCLKYHKLINVIALNNKAENNVMLVSYPRNVMFSVSAYVNAIKTSLWENL
jgi:hypothetical protein